MNMILHKVKLFYPFLGMLMHNGKYEVYAYVFYMANFYQ